jgi:hypothetical protein
MIYPDSPDRNIVQRYILIGGDALKLDDRGIRGREYGKVRPDSIVEEVGLDVGKDCLSADNIDGVVGDTHHICSQERNVLDVIEVGMGDQDVSNLCLFTEIERRSNCPCIQDDSVVDEETDGIKTAQLSSITP